MGQTLRGLQRTAATFSVLLGGTLVALAVFFVATVMLVRLRAYVTDPPAGPRMISVDRPPPAPGAVSERPTLTPDQRRMVEEKARTRPAAPTPPAAADPAQTAVVLAVAVVAVLGGLFTQSPWLVVVGALVAGAVVVGSGYAVARRRRPEAAPG